MAKKTATKLFDNEVAEGEAKDLPSDVTENKKEEEIVDIDLSILERKRFRINGDNNKILKLNTSDLFVGSRMEEAYNKLNKLMDEVMERIGEVPDNKEEVTDEQATDVFDALKEIDAKMREQVDYIFDSNVSELCADDGSMWDIREGAFRYEIIIEAISRLYENDLDKEFTKLKNRVEGRTAQIKKIGGSKYHK